jgi:hemerythrin superfamily protein
MHSPGQSTNRAGARNQLSPTALANRNTRSGTMAAQSNAIALLKADHRKVEELFEKYETARSKKEDIARQICLELTIHSMVEEELFYPACKGVVEDDNLDEAQVEHDGAKVLIAELQEGSPEDDFFDAKVKVLSEEIKHHVKEEEKRGGIFSQVKDSDVDLDALGEQIAERKKELMATFTKAGVPAPVTRSMTAKSIKQGEPLSAPGQA